MQIRISNELFNEKKNMPNTFSYRQKTRDLAQDLQHHLEKNKSSTTPLCPGDQLLLESEKKREENLKHLVAFYRRRIKRKQEVALNCSLDLISDQWGVNPIVPYWIP